MNKTVFYVAILVITVSLAMIGSIFLSGQEHKIQSTQEEAGIILLLAGMFFTGATTILFAQSICIPETRHK